jgi:hypothetical protein
MALTEDPTSIPAAPSGAAKARMTGFDDMPHEFRLFLHEYAGVMPLHQIDQIACILRAGHRVEIATPDGKRHKLRPG